MELWVIALVALAAGFGVFYWEPRVTAYLDKIRFQSECSHPEHLREEITQDWIPERVFRCTRCGKQLSRDETGGKIPRD